MSTAPSPLWALSAAALVEGYRNGAFSPVEALASVLDRLDGVNPRINAVILVDREGAAAAAARSAERWSRGEPLSVLDGVPLTVKDNIFVGRLRATWGSRVYADFVPAEDEPAIACLRAAGAVILGKTNVPELTVQGYTSNLLFGTTENAIAPGRTPGGSTGGGASAVAAGIGPIAIGTDGGGSLRRPAAHCGVYALKPSIGQVARDGGFFQLLSDFEVIGPVGRTLDDVARAFAVLRGFDRGDPRSLVTLAEPPERPAPLRVAYMPGMGNAPVDRRIREAAERTAAAFEEAGCRVERIEPPFDPDESAAAWSTIAGVGLAAHFAGLEGWQAKVGPSVRDMAEAGAKRSATEHVMALATASRLRAEAGRFFDRFDLLLCPAIAALAWPAAEVYPPEIDGRAVGPRGHAVFTSWMNVAGLPALSVPVATTPEEGGIGMQIVGPHGADLWLLRTAARLLDQGVFSA